MSPSPFVLKRRGCVSTVGRASIMMDLKVTFSLIMFYSADFYGRHFIWGADRRRQSRCKFTDAAADDNSFGMSEATQRKS